MSNSSRAPQSSAGRPLAPRLAVPVTGTVGSPCISVCRMNEATGLCEGCLRTIDEIAAWGSLGDDAKRRVLDDIALRRADAEAP